ncbi:hypothetical protein EJ08DRAFT_407079 [Tothia fuscella]|uniref:Secreted protein n=1 Tax=Tothia fuscella TaxID=1048955 RepID=A0A9P4NK90_9PEZI|nr:hypothetical protein EJ08DRAFT_407079 [Tothia fuscella]
MFLPFAVMSCFFCFDLVDCRAFSCFGAFLPSCNDTSGWYLPGFNSLYWGLVVSTALPSSFEVVFSINLTQQL